MKRILILLLGLFSVAYGQFAPTSAKTAFKWGVSIGTRDSTAYAANDSLVVVINRQGRMMYRSTDGYWKLLSNVGVNDYVPYNGANANVFLGSNRIKADAFDLGIPSTSADSIGRMRWNADDLTMNIGLTSSVVLQSGQEMLILVKNQTGVTIPNGTVVRQSGVVGASGRLKVEPFLANGTHNSNQVLGLTTEDIPNGGDGFVAYFGKVRGLNTAAYPDSTILYASTTVAGALTDTVPEAPNNIVKIGTVVKSAASNGIIFARVVAGSNINQDEGVQLINPVDKSLLVYDSASTLWKNGTLASVGGIRVQDTASMLAPFVQYSDTASMLTGYVKLQNNSYSEQQTGKINISDTILTNGILKTNTVLKTDSISSNTNNKSVRVKSIKYGQQYRSNVFVLTGDSRSAGYNCTTSIPITNYMNLGVPPQLNFTKYNVAIGGQTAYEIDSSAWDNVDPLISNVSNLNIVTIWAGVNDMAFGDLPADSVYRNIQAFAKMRKAKGWKVIVCTEISMGGTGSYGLVDLTRLKLNDSLRNNWTNFADYIVDLASNPIIGSVGAHLNRDIFCDNYHLTDSGSAIVAGMIQDAVFNYVRQQGRYFNGPLNIIQSENNRLALSVISRDSSIKQAIDTLGRFTNSVRIKSDNTYIDSDNFSLQAQFNHRFYLRGSDTYVDNVGNGTFKNISLFGLINGSQSDSIATFQNNEFRKIKNNFLTYSDTSTILSPYLRKSDTASMLENRLKISDTTTMLITYLRKSDTSSMLSKYVNLYNSQSGISGDKEFTGYIKTGKYFSSSGQTNTLLGAGSNFFGYLNYWGLRTATDNSFNVDIYNGGALISALNISQNGGVATFNDSVKAKSFVKSGGTSSQYLMADGSVTSVTSPNNDLYLSVQSLSGSLSTWKMVNINTSTSGSLGWRLPAASSNTGRVIEVINKGNNTSFYIDTAGEGILYLSGGTVQSTTSIGLQYGRLISDGTNWYLVTLW